MSNKTNIENARRNEHINERTLNHNAIARWGRVYLTMQPQTASYLQHNNLTLVNPDKFEELRNLALELRNTIGDRNISVFSTALIEYYNRAGRLMDQIKNPNSKKYGKYIEYFNTEEEIALFVMLVIDPELEYYNTYMSEEDKIKALNNKYGFISKELLKIERIYDFIIKYREKGKDEKMISYLVNKLYNVEDKGEGR